MRCSTANRMPHAYFGRMKRQNKQGPVVLGPLSPLHEYDSTELARALDSDEVVLLDTRGHDEVHAGAVPGALNIPGVGKAASFGAWVYDPEREGHSTGGARRGPHCRRRAP